MPVAKCKWIADRKTKRKKTRCPSPIPSPSAKQASHTHSHSLPASNGTPQTLAFINVDNPEQVKDQATQRKIRRHVMGPIGASRRKGGTQLVKRRQDPAAAAKLLLLPLSTPSYWGEVRICINFQRLFRAMNMVSMGLLSMTVDDTVRKRRPRAYDDLYGGVQRGDEEDQTRSLREMQQYTDSLGLVRNSIRKPESLATRHAVLGTVICLAYFDLRVRNHEGWKMHMQGLETMIRLYGGVDALESHQALRQSLFLTDVLGALVYDAPPRYPQLRHASSPIRATTTAGSFGDDTPSIIIDSAVRSASRLAVLLNHVPRRCANRMALDILLPVSEIAHDILSLPRLDHHILAEGTHSATSTPASLVSAVVTELVRVSALAMVSTVITTTSGDDLYCAAYRRGLEQDLLVYAGAQGWTGREQLRLWVLVIQGLMETGPSRTWFLDEIVDAMGSLSLQSWEDLVSCLHQVAWVTHAAMQEMNCLRSDVEQRLVHRCS